MSERLVRVFLRLYPQAWRDRYGDELSILIEESRADRSQGHILADVLVAGVVERLRSIGLLGIGLTPEDRTRSGVLRVLWGWVIFVVGGIGVAKASEYWGNAVPATNRGLPSGAYGIVVVTSLIGSALVVLAIALTSGKLFAFLRTGGWPKVKTPILRAAVLTALAVGALVGAASWAHHLSPAQRNGADNLYSAAILCFILLFLSCLAAWTIATVRTARAISLTRQLLSAEALIAALVAATMVVMTVATAVWWASVARDAGTVLPLNLVIAGLLMITGAALGCSGANGAIGGIRHRAQT